MGDTRSVTLGRYDSPREMTATEAAYLAGMIDGEGSICVLRTRPRDQARPSYRFVMSVTNTDLHLLGELGEWVGVGTLQRVAKSKANPKWKDGGQLFFNQGAAAHVLRQVLPYLIVKRRQAELAIEFLALKRAWSRENDNSEQQAAIYRRMGKLNARGAAHQKAYTFRHRPAAEPKLCTYEGCAETHYGNGYCRKHYRWIYESKSWSETTGRACQHCGEALPENARIDAKFCSLSCKMKHHRRHGAYTAEALADAPRCSVEGCDRPRQAKGLCRRHYMQEWHAAKRAAIA